MGKSFKKPKEQGAKNASNKPTKVKRENNKSFKNYDYVKDND